MLAGRTDCSKAPSFWEESSKGFCKTAPQIKGQKFIYGKSNLLLSNYRNELF